MTDARFSTPRRRFLGTVGVVGLATAFGTPGRVAATYGSPTVQPDGTVQTDGTGPIIIDQPGVYHLLEDTTRPVRITADDVVFDGYDSSEVNVESGPAISVEGDDVVVFRTFFEGTGGILFDDVTGGRVEACGFLGSHGIELSDCFQTELWNNYFRDCPEPAMLVDSDECLVRENRIYRPELKGINVIRGYGNVVTDNRVTESRSRDGIYVVDSRRAIVAGNRSEENDRSGIRVTQSADCVVCGNWLAWNGAGGVTVNASTDTFVVGNYVFDDVPVSIIGGSQDTTAFGNAPD